MNKENIFTKNGSFLLHIIVIVFISCSIANFLFWPWAQFFLGGQALSILIGGFISWLVGYLREKFGNNSKSDMKANWIGLGSSVILNLVIFNFGYGV